LGAVPASPPPGLIFHRETGRQTQKEPDARQRPAEPES